MKFEPIIGLEIHAELTTETKMFCGCLNDPDERHPNVHICPVCTGQPGALPVANKKAIESVLKVGMAMGGDVAVTSKFDRKNYFYPDLPKGYQISQYDKPLVTGGALHVVDEQARIDKRVSLTRIHLEEDTARMVHDPSGDSLVDFNRSGVPLMELVTEPELRGAQEARLFAEEFRTLMRYLGVSAADMERGQMRIEANISLRPEGASDLPEYKVEIKNINSFRAVEAAIAYEIERQEKALKKGTKLIQETRGWRDDKGVTESQRHKEEAHDYRYFPEPDLPPFDIAAFEPDILRASIPELPDQKARRFREEYSIDAVLARMLTREKEEADFFEAASSELRAALDDPEKPGPASEETYRRGLSVLLNYFTTDLRGIMKDDGVDFSGLKITPEHFAHLVGMIVSGEISSRIAKDLLAEMYTNGGDPHEIIKEKGMEQVSDEDAIVEAVKKAMEEHSQAVADYKGGKESALQFLFGQTMRALKGRGNPDVIRKTLKKLLEE